VAGAYNSLAIAVLLISRPEMEKMFNSRFPVTVNCSSWSINVNVISYTVYVSQEDDFEPATLQLPGEFSFLKKVMIS
jgi:hypothetical protein